MRFIAFLVLSSVAVFLITVFFRLGGHKSPEIEQKESPILYLIYKEHIGSYHKINSVIESVERVTLENNLPCAKTFGEYLDDPRLRDESRLRSHGGCLLPSPLPMDEKTWAEIKNEHELDYKVIEPQLVIYARFDGAPSIGPFKVYPQVEKYMEENSLVQSGPVIEIYTIHGAQEALTEYYFPITKRP